MSNPFVTIIQQGTSPKVVEANGTLRQTLVGEGIDVDAFSVMRGGVEIELDNDVTSDTTVTVTKKSVGA